VYDNTYVVYMCNSKDLHLDMHVHARTRQATEKQMKTRMVNQVIHVDEVNEYEVPMMETQVRAAGARGAEQTQEQ